MDGLMAAEPSAGTVTPEPASSHRPGFAIRIDGGLNSTIRPPLLLAGDMSFTGWIKPADRAVAYAFGGGMSSPTEYFQLGTNGDVVIFLTTSGGTVTFTGAAGPAGAWWWFGFSVKDATKTVTFYRDGLRIASGISGLGWAASQALVWGARGSNANILLGSLARLRAWQRVLTDAEFEAAYHEVVPPGAAGDWPCDDGGVWAHDESGAGNHGVVFRNPVTSAPQLWHYDRPPELG